MHVMHLHMYIIGHTYMYNVYMSNVDLIGQVKTSLPIIIQLENFMYIRTVLHVT